jgi:hypothetical protein
MVPVAVVDELLFTAFTAVERGPEVSDIRSLTGGAERTEGRVHVSGLLPDRTIGDSIDHLHGIPPGKRSTGRVPWFTENKHAERCEQVVEEAYGGIAVVGGDALTNHHIPIGFLLRCNRFSHCTKGSLLVHEPYFLERTEQVLVDLLCQPVPVFRCKFLDFFAKIPFHLVDIRRRMPKHEKSNFSPEFPAGDSQLEVPAFAHDLCTGAAGIRMILASEQEQGHGTGLYLRLTDFLPQEYSFCNQAIIFPNIFISFIPTITHGDCHE